MLETLHAGRCCSVQAKLAASGCWCLRVSGKRRSHQPDVPRRRLYPYGSSGRGTARCQRCSYHSRGRTAAPAPCTSCQEKHSRYAMSRLPSAGSSSSGYKRCIGKGSPHLYVIRHGLCSCSADKCIWRRRRRCFDEAVQGLAKAGACFAAGHLCLFAVVHSPPNNPLSSAHPFPRGEGQAGGLQQGGDQRRSVWLHIALPSCTAATRKTTPNPTCSRELGLQTAPF